MRQLKKSRWGALTAKWVAHDTRDEVVDYVCRWSERTELPAKRLVQWIGLAMSKYYDWTKRYGKANEHNRLVPRDHWLEAWEREAILTFHAQHPLEGYRRLTYMLMDADRVAASPATVYRVLKQAGCFQRWNRPESRKGQGFQQPLAPHEHWHIDISYVNVCGTFYYLISVLDGCSRYIVHWELRESMKEADVEVVLQRAREAFPDARPRIISDNGPQFVAKDFKEFIRISGMTHVRTSPYYPQSNGKLEPTTAVAAVPARDAQTRLSAARGVTLDRGSPPARGPVRRAIQSHAAALGLGLCDARRQARRSSSRHLRRTRSETRRCPRAQGRSMPRTRAEQ